MHTNVKQQYLKAVTRSLPVSMRHKKQLLTALQDSLEQYLIRHPDASMEELSSSFGSPAEVAAGIIASAPDEVSNWFRFSRTRLILLVLALILVLLLIWRLLLFYQETENAHSLYFEETIIEND